MIVIFSQLNSDLKASVEVYPNQIPMVIGKLQEKFGGTWIENETQRFGQCLIFQDDTNPNHSLESKRRINIEKLY